MSDGTYKKIFKVRKQLQDLDFEEDMLFGIAAALATKFTLVPKDLGVENDEDDDDADVSLEMEEEDDLPRRQPRKIKRMQNVKGMSPQTARRIEQAQHFEEAEDLAHLSPEEEAQIQAEWGMTVASSDNMPLPSGEKAAGASTFEEMFSSMDGLGTDPDMPGQPLPSNASADQGGSHAALLARAQAAKNDPGKFKVRRVDR